MTPAMRLTLRLWKWADSTPPHRRSFLQRLLVADYQRAQKRDDLSRFDFGEET